RVRELFPETEADKEIPVIFWFRDTEDRPKSITRMIPGPNWADIQENYPPRTQAGLGRLMDGFRPSSHGQLILWQGEPGTGKTWSLRALAREWRDWCWFEYVTDPEASFGSADY